MSQYVCPLEGCGCSFASAATLSVHVLSHSAPSVPAAAPPAPQLPRNQAQQHALVAVPEASAAALQGPHDIEEDAGDDENAPEDFGENDRDPALSFVPYEASLDPHLKALASGHPSPIVETASMACVKPTAALNNRHAKLLMPAKIISNAISAEQMEAVLLATIQHSKFMATRERCGFYLGDGTGVGKGRVIAALLLHNFFRHCLSGQRSQFKAIWISQSHDLLQDAKRDLDDLWADCPIQIRRKLPKPELFKMKETTPTDLLAITFATHGCIFTNYPMLVRRYDQLTQWLPEAFDGLIVFDEAHRAKNLFPQAFTFGKSGSAMAGGRRGDKARAGRGGAGAGRGSDSEEASPGKVQGPGTQTGNKVVEIQENFPLARIVYSSATSAIEVRHLGYMTRLGLWGEGTPFPCFWQKWASRKAQRNAGRRAQRKGQVLDFVGEMTSNGLSAMEMIAVELKLAGKYVARSLSFKGTIFTIKTVNLSPVQQDLYAAACQFWMEMMQVGDKANDLMLYSQPDDSRRRSHRSFVGTLWGLHQIFFRQLLASFKVDETVKQVKQALEDGCSCVVTIQQTGEGRLLDEHKRRSEDGEQVLGLLSSSRETVRSRLLDWRGTMQELADEAEPGSGLQEQVAPLLTSINKLVARLEEFALPPNAVDALKVAFDATLVGEISGRTKEQVFAEDGTVHMENRSSEKSNCNNLEREAFVNGQKRIMLLTAAGSAGISLHAGRKFQNKQKRIHFIVQLPWQADAFVQQCGRTSRSDQAHCPEYVYITTDVSGEARFASSLALRVESLGALTRGCRTAAHPSSKSLEVFNVENSIGLIALSNMLDAIHIDALVDFYWLWSAEQKFKQAYYPPSSSSSVFSTPPTSSIRSSALPSLHAPTFCLDCGGYLPTVPSAQEAAKGVLQCPDCHRIVSAPSLFAPAVDEEGDAWEGGGFVTKKRSRRVPGGGAGGGGKRRKTRRGGFGAGEGESSDEDGQGKWESEGEDAGKGLGGAAAGDGMGGRSTSMLHYNFLRKGLPLYRELQRRGAVKRMEGREGARQLLMARQRARRAAAGLEGRMGEGAVGRTALVGGSRAGCDLEAGDDGDGGEEEDEGEDSALVRRLVGTVQLFLLADANKAGGGSQRGCSGWPRHGNSFGGGGGGSGGGGEGGGNGRWDAWQAGDNCYSEHMQRLAGGVWEALSDRKVVRPTLKQISEGGAMPKELVKLICGYLEPDVPTVHGLIDMVGKARVAGDYHAPAVPALSEEQRQSMSEDAIHLHQKNRAKSLLKRVPRVKTFLNRLLGLPTPTQTLLYDLFEARFSAEKRQQARAGLTSGLERGMKESKREVCELLREVEIRSDDNGCPTSHVVLRATIEDPRQSFARAMVILRQKLSVSAAAQRDGRSGFYTHRWLHSMPPRLVILKDSGYQSSQSGFGQRFQYFTAERKFAKLFAKSSEDALDKFTQWKRMDPQPELQAEYFSPGFNFGARPDEEIAKLLAAEITAGGSAKELWDKHYKRMAVASGAMEEVHMLTGGVTAWWSKVKSVARRHGRGKGKKPSVVCKVICIRTTRAPVRTFVGLQIPSAVAVAVVEAIRREAEGGVKADCGRGGGGGGGGRGEKDDGGYMSLPFKPDDWNASSSLSSSSSAAALSGAAVSDGTGRQGGAKEVDASAFRPERQYLAVPEEEAQEARAMGLPWDAGQRRFFIRHATLRDGPLGTRVRARGWIDEAWMDGVKLNHPMTHVKAWCSRKSLTQLGPSQDRINRLFDASDSDSSGEAIDLATEGGGGVGRDGVRSRNIDSHTTVPNVSSLQSHSSLAGMTEEQRLELAIRRSLLADSISDSSLASRVVVKAEGGGDEGGGGDRAMTIQGQGTSREAAICLMSDGESD